MYLFFLFFSIFFLFFYSFKKRILMVNSKQNSGQFQSNDMFQPDPQRWTAAPFSRTSQYLCCFQSLSRGQPETADHHLNDCTICESVRSYLRKSLRNSFSVSFLIARRALKRWSSFSTHYCTYSSDG
jgi:hypothetical protein